MKYLHTMVRVQNLQLSLAFYCDTLGLVEVRRKESETGRFTLVFLAAPEDLYSTTTHPHPTLELTYNWDPETYDSGRNFGHLAYQVPNIYDTCQTLIDKGITLNRPPRDGYMAFIKSPDNISIELLQSGERLAPEEPWLSMPNIGKW